MVAEIIYNTYASQEVTSQLELVYYHVIRNARGIVTRYQRMIDE